MRQKLRKHARQARYILYQETLFDFKEHVWTFLGSFAGIALIGLLNRYFLGANDTMLLVGSFGASSVLIYGIINSPLAQPRNLIGGHLLSAFVGVTVYKLVPGELWLAAALAVSLSIIGMQITKTLHPPGGATALIATIGSPQLKALGYWYMVMPVLSGISILLLVALLFNNATSSRRYPTNKYWYKVWQRGYGRT
ncbi:HPP family protein [Hymenobacter gelipurpurascens]|uniref:HPP family protein n=1 Tax=Hymenobacter gelipurpurascens TaxID=89968 RepID=A0A212UC78_9BACT|nr:HPP family protein [Hymenobacter gelipurpurascens]SNC75837.1 HPP family protein [Hymenobacter gelipurpurascens]